MQDHISLMTKQKLWQLDWEVLTYLLYSPDSSVSTLTAAFWEILKQRMYIGYSWIPNLQKVWHTFKYVLFQAAKLQGYLVFKPVWASKITWGVSIFVILKFNFYKFFFNIISKNMYPNTFQKKKERKPLSSPKITTLLGAYPSTFFLYTTYYIMISYHTYYSSPCCFHITLS